MSLRTAVEECAREWGVVLDGETLLAPRSLVAFAGDAVVKVQIPDRESRHEADALRAWDGDDAVRLLAADDERHALLLERCRPGTPLAGLPQDEALDALVGLLPRLWRPVAAPFRPLGDEAAWWQESLPRHWEQRGRPFERRLLDAALAALRELPSTPGGEVLRRLDRLTRELGLDRERARRWSLAQTLAWSFDCEYHASHVETARWLLQA